MPEGVAWGSTIEGTRRALGAWHKATPAGVLV
jgi:hypothetical protein